MFHSLTARGKVTKTVSINHNFVKDEKGELVRNRTEVLLSACQPNALSLGQTGSRFCLPPFSFLSPPPPPPPSSSFFFRLFVQCPAADRAPTQTPPVFGHTSEIDLIIADSSVKLYGCSDTDKPEPGLADAVVVLNWRQSMYNGTSSSCQCLNRY